MDQLYTYTTEHHPEFGEGNVEHYHGDNYCKNVITDVLNTLTPSDWEEQKYLGSRDRIANETFVLSSTAGSEYNISFAVSTYNREAARLEITITAPETEGYDHRLEKLKIALKNRLLPDWHQCTWLVDEQAAALCKNAYEKTFVIENNLRAFASKVLVHFLGVDWIKKAGLEKEAESVNTLKEKFIQRVSDFDNINTDFLSMTLETLVGVMFKGVTYRDDVILSRQDYTKVQAMGARQKTTGNNIAEYIKNLRTVDKRIWDDLFVPYIDDPSAFKTAVHNFIEDRNHVAHSKVLSWSAYQVILQDFEKMDSLILSADLKFEHDETADEVIQTWQVEQENDEYEQEFYRERLADETGMDVLGENEIKNWFEEVLHELYDLIYQQYHLDVCYDISDLTTPNEDEVAFTISCPAVEDGNAKIDIVTEYSIDDGLGEDSVCYIAAKDRYGREISKAEVRFHNGNGCESEEGIMEATDNPEYDISGLDGFQDDLLAAIESLNPYPEKLDALSYENKGAVQFIADFPCEQCGKFGVSIDESFLTVGRCCYCGHENELAKCERCGEMVNVDLLEYGLCPSCTAYIHRQ
ncbi:hypothetical protein [Frisingicoccus sp.]|uniref:hypothetical protein n=1 Tax=Frisingicoccus sp. TaxID=1918627 RepID=UPI003AB6365B